MAINEINDIVRIFFCFTQLEGEPAFTVDKSFIQFSFHKTNGILVSNCILFHLHELLCVCSLTDNVLPEVFGVFLSTLPLL